jgi:hypothetical protein
VLILSDAKITIKASGEIRLEGNFVPHAGKIAGFLRELGLTGGVIRRRFGRFVFSREIDPSAQQRLRNFFHSECPMKGR